MKKLFLVAFISILGITTQITQASSSEKPCIKRFCSGGDVVCCQAEGITTYMSTTARGIL